MQGFTFIFESLIHFQLWFFKRRSNTILFDNWIVKSGKVFWGKGFLGKMIAKYIVFSLWNSLSLFGFSDNRFNFFWDRFTWNLFDVAYIEGKTDGCAPPIESFVESVIHSNDRNRPTTQTASLIAASFRTWRGSWPFVAWRPIKISDDFLRIRPYRGNSAPRKRISGIGHR